jgi:hypothetical protein
MTPYRLTRPTVGLMPASMFWFDGLRIEPEVSVPTFAAQKLTAVPMPELEPPVLRTGRPSEPAGFVGRREAGECQRAARRRHVGGVDVVLDRYRDAVERAAAAPGEAFAIERGGIFESARVDVERGAQPVFVHPDPRQRLAHELDRRDALGVQRLPHRGNGRFDHCEGRTLRGDRDGDREAGGNGEHEADAHATTPNVVGLSCICAAQGYVKAGRGGGFDPPVK